MKRFLAAAAVTAAIALASSVAVAQTVPQPQPSPGPIPTPDSGNGGLFLWAYDSVRNVSLVDYLGLTFSQVLPTSDMTTEGFTLDFGAVSQYSTVFNGSSVSNIEWGVGAADFLGGVASTSLVSTGPKAATDLFMNAAGLVAAGGQINNFVLNVNTACGAGNPCTANNPDQGQFAGQATWGDTWGGGLGWDATANPGTALGFYHVTPGPGTRPTGANVAAFASLGGVYGEWLLDANGNLKYSVAGNSIVPLPAAVWLFLSAGAGLVTLSRRRKGADGLPVAA
jgi:hypothetical protein